MVVTRAYGRGGSDSANKGAMITANLVKTLEMPMLVATNRVGKKFGCTMNTVTKF